MWCRVAEGEREREVGEVGQVGKVTTSFADLKCQLNIKGVNNISRSDSGVLNRG